MVSSSTDRFNGVIAAQAIKVPVKAVAIANITLSGEQTVNSVAVVADDRVLVTAQTSSVDNGIYDVSTGAWARSADWDGNRDVVNGTLVPQKESASTYSLYVVDTADPIEAGTTAVTIGLAALNVGTAIFLLNSNNLLEGYTTGRNVIRCTRLRLQPGATPGTNINVTDTTGAGSGFNSPSITDAIDLAKSGTAGSFSLNADGRTLTMDLTEAVIGVGLASCSTQDLNSSTAPTWFVNIGITGSNLVLNLTTEGSQTTVDLTTVLDAGDLVDIYLMYFTGT